MTDWNRTQREFNHIRDGRTGIYCNNQLNQIEHNRNGQTEKGARNLKGGGVSGIEREAQPLRDEQWLPGLGIRLFGSAGVNRRLEYYGKSCPWAFGNLSGSG